MSDPTSHPEPCGDFPPNFLEALAAYEEGLASGKASRNQMRARCCEQFPECRAQLEEHFQAEDHVQWMLETQVPEEESPAIEIEGITDLQKIGQGAFGQVYRGRQAQTEAEVVIKRITGAFERVENEFRAAQLNHPNVVRILSVGKHAGRPYLLMPYYSGGTLADRLATFPQRRAPIPLAVSWMTKLARALAYVHTKSIRLPDGREAQMLHRDIKPSNILFDEHDEPILSDFGLARGSGDLTLSRGILGTPAYLAPEITSPTHHSQCSDLWALGLVFAEMLTGSHRINKRLRDYRKEIPESLEAICRKCLEEDPAQRYVSADELVADLDNISKNFPPLLARISPVERWRLWFRRSRWTAVATVLLIMAAVGCVVLGGVAGAFALSMRQALDDRQVALEETASKNQELEALIQERDSAFAELADRNQQLQDQIDRTALQEYAHQITRTLGYLQGEDYPSARESLEFTLERFRGIEYQLLHEWIAQMSHPLKDLEGFQTQSCSGQVFGETLTLYQVEQPEGQPGRLRLNVHKVDASGAAGEHDHRRFTSASELLNETEHLQRAVVSPDGKVIAAATYNRELETHHCRLWMRDEDHFHELELPDSLPSTEVISIAFSPDGARLALGFRQGEVCLIDLSDNRLIFRDDTHNHPASLLCFSDDGLQTASASNRTLRVFNTVTGQTLHEFEISGEGGVITAMVFAPDSGELVTGDASGRVRFFPLDADQGLKNMKTVFEVNEPVTCLRHAPGGGLLAVGYQSGHILVLVQRGRLSWGDRSRRINHREPVVSLCFDAHGLHLTSVHADGAVHVNLLDKYPLRGYDVDESASLLLQSHHSGGLRVLHLDQLSMGLVFDMPSYDQEADQKAETPSRRVRDIRFCQGETDQFLLVTSDNLLVRFNSQGLESVIREESPEKSQWFLFPDGSRLIEITTPGIFSDTPGPLPLGPCRLWSLSGQDLVPEMLEHIEENLFIWPQDLGSWGMQTPATTPHIVLERDNRVLSLTCHERGSELVILDAMFGMELMRYQFARKFQHERGCVGTGMISDDQILAVYLDSDVFVWIVDSPE